MFRVALTSLTAGFVSFPQHFLNFVPEPQGAEPITWSRLRICGLGWVVLQNEPESGFEEGRSESETCPTVGVGFWDPAGLQNELIPDSRYCIVVCRLTRSRLRLHQ